ncbi:MAG: hypothetical protein COY22_01385 [Candidatus Tagabacteria bacterium CG_4_10_14_0_2_um_filter_40_13]|nr:MAG: hypothetical protein COV12_00435 [Candidatus Woesearchaeota archaeon CG10_big_fil_rev_8_21_14_0_10_32_24]PIZ56357.1 MAG: hypothetical protein COY22_01385 [Candidatus Tagabacteria bacterium CG_4_10_14_0_2_um_filter_40_13]
MNQKDFEKHVHEAIKWVATEHKFFEDLSADLQLLKRDITLAKEKNEVKDIKHALGDFRYIGKAERRFDNHEKHVEDFLEKLRKHELTVTGSVHDIQQLFERLHTEAANLIKDSSLYNGKIRELLLHLKDTIEDHEIEQAHAVLVEVEQLIEDAEKWIAALPIDLKKAKQIVQETNFDKSADMYRDPNLEDFNNSHTLKKVKGFMEAYGLSNVKFQKEKERNMVSGYYDSKENERRFTVTFMSEVSRKGLIWFYCQGSTSQKSINYNHAYQIGNRSRFDPPNFKAFLEKMLVLVTKGKDSELRELMES